MKPLFRSNCNGTSACSAVPGDCSCSHGAFTAAQQVLIATNMCAFNHSNGSLFASWYVLPMQLALLQIEYASKKATRQPASEVSD